MINTKFSTFNKDKKKINSVFDKNSIAYITGQTGTGKSTVLLNILRHIQKEVDTFEEAYFFTGSKKDEILKNLGNDIIISSDPEFFYSLIDKMEAEQESPRRLIVIDDLASNPMFKLNTSKKFLNTVLNSRHNNLTLLITSQGYHQLNKQIRSQASLIFCFPCRNSKQEEDILNELPTPKEKLKKAMDIIKNRSDHDFLYLNIQKPTPRFFINFDEELKF